MHPVCATTQHSVYVCVQQSCNLCVCATKHPLCATNQHPVCVQPSSSLSSQAVPAPLQTAPSLAHSWLLFHSIPSHRPHPCLCTMQPGVGSPHSPLSLSPAPKLLAWASTPAPSTHIPTHSRLADECGCSSQNPWLGQHMLHRFPSCDLPMGRLRSRVFHRLSGLVLTGLIRLLLSVQSIVCAPTLIQGRILRDLSVIGSPTPIENRSSCKCFQIYANETCG